MPTPEDLDGIKEMIRHAHSPEPKKMLSLRELEEVVKQQGERLKQLEKQVYEDV